MKKFLFLILLFIISFCQKPSKNNTSNLRTFTMPISSSVQSIDPIFATNETRGIVATLVHRYLFRVNYKGKTVNDLVIKEVLLSRQSIWKLILHPEAITNGLTAYFAAKSLNRILDSGRFFWVFDGVKKIYASDDNTLVLLLENTPSKSFIESLKTRLSLPTCAILPWKDNQPVMTPTLGDFFVKENNLTKLVLLRRMADLLKGDKYIFDKIVLPVVKNKASKQFLYQKGSFDYYEADGPYALMSEYPIKDVFQPWRSFYKTELTVLYAAMMQNEDKDNILNNVSFRRWLNFAFKQDMVCKKYLQNSCLASDIVVPDAIGIKIAPEYFTRGDPPRKKKKYLREKKYFYKQWQEDVGEYVKKKVIQIFSPPDLIRQSIAQSLFQILTHSGLRIKLNVYDLSTLIKLNNSRVTGIYIFKWIADYPHFENFLMPLFHSKNLGSRGNRAYYSDKKTDALLDNIERTGNLKQALLRIRKMAPWVFIGFDQKKVFINERKVQNSPLTYTGWWSVFKK